MLEFHQVSKTRRQEGQPVSILRQLSLSVQPAAITSILGPSGSGKSTLIRLANRLEDPDQGKILFQNQDIRYFDPLELRRRIGMVTQVPFMFPGSVLENLQKVFSLRRQAPPSSNSPLIESVMEICQLPVQLLSRDALKLSIGQQQRVSLARTLAGDPEVLLLDEPTSALDRPTGDRLCETLRGIVKNRQLTVLMVTHDLRVAERISDRLAFLDQGKILEEGAVAELLRTPRNPRLKAFLSEPKIREVEV